MTETTFICHCQELLLPCHCEEVLPEWEGRRGNLGLDVKIKEQRSKWQIKSQKMFPLP
jgi:hypothetical protein